MTVSANLGSLSCLLATRNFPLDILLFNRGFPSETRLREAGRGRRSEKTAFSGMTTAARPISAVGALLVVVNQNEKRANRRHNKYLLKFVITSASMYTIITGLKKADYPG